MAAGDEIPATNTVGSQLKSYGQGGSQDVLDNFFRNNNGATITIADASVAHALNSTFSDTEVETALDALGTKINLLIDALVRAGIYQAS